MKKSQPLFLGVKMGATLNYTVFCNYCSFEFQEHLNIKSIRLLENVIQKTIKVNPIKEYTQTNWKNWIKSSQLIILEFNDVWKKLKEIRQTYLRKTIQEMWQKINDFDYSRCDSYYNYSDNKFQKEFKKYCGERQRELTRELACTNHLWESLSKIKQKSPS